MLLREALEGVPQRQAQNKQFEGKGEFKKLEYASYRTTFQNCSFETGSMKTTEIKKKAPDAAFAVEPPAMLSRRVLYPLAAGAFILIFISRMFLMESNLAMEGNVPQHRHIKFWDFPPESDVIALRPVFHAVEASVSFDDARGVVRFGTEARADFHTGHERLPKVFFQGPSFFISGWNPAGKKANATYNKQANKDLLPLLLSMSPRPSKVVPR